MNKTIKSILIIVIVAAVVLGIIYTLQNMGDVEIAGDH
jgi:hypothetical protein